MNQNERREFLRNTDLEMSKQMEKIIKEAQPKPPKDIQPLLLKPVYPNVELTGTPEYKANKQMTDLLLAQQLETTITDAMDALSGKTTATSSKANSVPQTMMDDYIKANEVDINADQTTLYNPVTVPIIVKPALKPLPSRRLITQTDYENETARLINAFEAELIQREKIQTAEKDTTDLINTGKFGGAAPFDDAGRRAELNDKTKYKYNADLKALLPVDEQAKGGTRAEIINRIIRVEKNIAGEAELKKNLAIIQKDLQANAKNIVQAENEIKAFETLYQTQLRTIEENKQIEKEYQAGVHQTAEELLDNFNLINSGKIKIVREPGETDDALMKRIDNLSKAPVNPANIQNQIKLKTFNQAKKNVLELTSELDKAETVVKSLNITEQDSLNKMFPKIKEEYKKNFGLNNKSLSDDDIKQFIKNEITTGNALFTAPTANAPVIAPDEELKTLKAQMRQFTKPQFEQIIDELNNDNPELKLKKGGIKEMVREINNAGLYNASKFRTMLKLPDVNVAAFPIEVKAAPEPVLEPDDFGDNMVSMFGSGIKNHVLPSTVPFGKISMDLNKLFYQNILSIKRHNGNKIIGHKNKRVSDNFVDIIMKMFEGKPVTQSDLKNIKDERLLYDNLIVQSGLHKSKSIPTTIEQTSQEMKNRLGLIVGEIEAGNSNKSLLTELHELLFKMVRVHLISKSAATKYFNNLKAEYYTQNPDLK
jgi:hypothetical protein